MTALVLFPSRIKFVNNDGTLTPEAYRALSDIVGRVGGTLGDSGVDTYADVVTAGLTSSSINVAYTDVQQPKSETRLISEIVQQPINQDIIFSDVMQEPIVQEYEEYTSPSTACTGAITTACVWKLTKYGNVITLTLPNVQGAGVATTNFTVGATIPAKYRPKADLAVRGGVALNNGNAQAAPPMIKVLTTGVISVWRDGTETLAFTVTTTAGLVYATSLTWNI